MNGVKLMAAVVAGVIPLTFAPEARAAVPPEIAGPPEIQWGLCDRPDLPVVKGVECGTLTVATDWSNPGEGTVALRTYRWKAENSKGTILNFPSGPGQTGDLSFSELRKALPGYDLVAFDPRGVGQSKPMTCETDKILKIPHVPPTGHKAFQALKVNQKGFWKSCTTGAPELDDHLDAYSTARDADALRRAVGVDSVNVYGFSYGTLLAERYLELFGDHVSGSILEGVMNPDQDRREFITTAAAGVEAVFNRFTRWCAATTDCVLHGQDPAEVFRKAQQKADTLPGTFHGSKWSDAMVTRYFEISASRDFAAVASGLRDLAEGRNPVADQEPGGEMPTRFEYADPIVCSDFPLAVATVQEARGDLKSARAAAPVVGFSTNASNYSSICLGGPDSGRPEPVSSRSVNPTLLLSNSHDPLTPVAWAKQVEKQLGNKAVHVRTDDVGHGGGMENPETLKRVQEYMARLNS